MKQEGTARIVRPILFLALLSALGLCACKKQEPGAGSAQEATKSAAQAAQANPAAAPGFAETAQYGARFAQRQPPSGFQVFDDPQSGRILAGTFSGNARSASMVLGALIRLVNPYFDNRFGVTSAARDRSDQNVLAAFDASLGGTAVRGLMLVGLTPGGGAVALLFDTPDRIENSFPRLADRLRGVQLTGGGGEAPDEPLQDVPCPDGKCAVGLPRGWQLTGYANGAVDVAGPNGERGDFGIFLPIGIQRPLVQGAAYGPYIADPVQAFVTLSTRGGMSGIRVLDAQRIPPPMGAGQAAYILASFSSNGRGHLGFLMVNTAPSVDGFTWPYYYSWVGAPEEVFRREFRLLLRVWSSWRISGRLIAERMQQAAESLREAREILRSMNPNLAEAFDRANRGWDDYIRELAVVEHTPTGGRGKFDQRFADELVRGDPTKYVIVPPSQYRPND